MEDKIYIIGHKSPDLDSVAAAISYARLKNQLENVDKFVPAVAGELNKETAYALEKFGFAKPELLANAAGSTLILVDHNEASQCVEGSAEAKIVEILDHHKFNLATSEPITITVKPWGASNTIIKKMFDWKGQAIDAQLAGLMLAAILVDTVITKSPTCTETDKLVIEELAAAAGIADWTSFGMEIFKVRSNVKELPPMDIIKSDFKDWDFKAGKFGVGQVETADLGEFADLEDGIMAELARLKEEGGYHTAMLFITDIIQEGSKFLIASDDAGALEAAFAIKLENDKAWMPGVMSRKKQVVPVLTEHFDK